MKPRPAAERPALTIGLVNNMPRAACSATERQFRQLLAEAGTEHDVALRCFRTTSLETGDSASRIEAIFEADLDAVIVTGAEPQSSNLHEEPIWPLITRLVDWGEEQALPMMWSCLAAHAAAFYLDGIERVRHDSKISGLFEGEVVSADHPLLQGLGDAWSVPHSRWNDLPEHRLAANGYRILVRSRGAGVDLFQKVSHPSFIFLQSHPEYDADSLQREFQRDVRRFVAGERHDAPVLPRSYFGALPNDWSSVHRENAEAILAWLCRCGEEPSTAPWRPTAATLFRNWLRGVAARKGRGRASHHQDVRQPGLVPC
jgi:homoserine O-succinyltransferase